MTGKIPYNPYSISLNHSIAMGQVYKCLFAVVSIFFWLSLPAQVKKYTTANAHSHNDYVNPTPFFLAFENGFGSIEADIFPVGDSLVVAHSKREIKPQNSLRNLYIIPIRNAFNNNGKRKLNLLIDIKENYAVTLALLMKELEPLKKFISTPTNPNFLTITITGNRPPPAEYKNYPEYIYFDDDLVLPHTQLEWRRVSLVSLPLYKIIFWKGLDSLPPKDQSKWKHIIDSVHLAGKTIRFWAAPDTEISWKWQMLLQTDLIGTDKINELAKFINKENK